MRRHAWRKLVGFSLLALLPLWLAFAEPEAGKGNRKDETKKAAAQKSSYQAPSRDPALYAGAETCATCHLEVSEAFATNPHHKTMLDTRRGVAWQGCESCHGPGKEHAESADVSKIFSFSGAPAGEASQRCLECHEFSGEHSSYARSAHARSDVGCLDCHSVHQPKVREQLLQASQPQLCYTCHLEVRTEFTRPFRHRVNEGLVSCNDCHNPHGGSEPRQLRAAAAQEAGCVQCHAEKRGPFVFEHAPVKAEGCVACHAPHGSSNPRMLKRSNVNLLCLECHSDSVHAAAPTPVGPAHNQMQKYQACTLCHSAVHGSNSSSGLFQ